jgi:hypothetical protein
MPVPQLKALAQKSKKSLKDLERYWDKAQEIAKKAGFKVTSKNYWPYVYGIVRNMAGINEMDNYKNYTLHFPMNQIHKMAKESGESKEKIAMLMKKAAIEVEDSGFQRDADDYWEGIIAKVETWLGIRNKNPAKRVQEKLSSSDIKNMKKRVTNSVIKKNKKLIDKNLSSKVLGVYGMDADQYANASKVLLDQNLFSALWPTILAAIGSGTQFKKDAAFKAAEKAYELVARDMHKETEKFLKSLGVKSFEDKTFDDYESFFVSDDLLSE